MWNSMLKNRRLLRILYLLFLVYQVMVLSFFISSYSIWNTTAYLECLTLITFSLIIDIGVIYSLHRLSDRLQKEQEYHNLNEQRNQTYQYYQTIQRHMQEMRLKKHDYVNFIHTIHALLPPNELTGPVQNLFTETIDELNRHTRAIYCENDIVNAVLSIKKETTGSHDIKTEFVVQVPKDIPIDSAELCSLFSNLLDNGIEANLQLEPQNRSISCRAQTQPGFLIIKTENPYDSIKTSQGKLRTTKTKHREDHGLGLLLIENIAARYHGSVEITTKDHVFQVVVILEL